MNLFASLSFVAKRLWRHRWLSFSQWVGLVAAVALSVAVPLYADGVNFSILDTSLTSGERTLDRKPFVFVFRYIGSWHGDLTVEQLQQVDEYLQERAAQEIGLPKIGGARYLASPNLQLYPVSETIQPENRLDRIKLAYLSDAFEHVQVVEGQLPQAPTSPNDPVDVLVSLDLANSLGLENNSEYTLYLSKNDDKLYRQPIRVRGLWIAKDEADPFWTFYPASSFEKKLLLPEESWYKAVEGLDTPVNEAAWHLELDGSKVNSENVPTLLGRIDQVSIRASTYLPNLSLETSPAPALRSYRSSAQRLTGSLFAFSLPVIALVLYFLSLVSGFAVQYQRNEIAVFRSRGTSRLWVTGIYFVERSMLGALALFPGMLLGKDLSHLTGRTTSFLQFSGQRAFTTHIGAWDWLAALLTILAVIIFSLIPVWRASNNTIISHRVRQARALHRPLWRRAFVDILLLAVGGYGLYTLKAQGRLAILNQNLGAADPFQNPLLFLLPMLFMAGACLFIFRLLPLAVDALAEAFHYLPWATPVYALRQFARSGGATQQIMVLISFTIGLSVFVSSMALSLDAELRDNLYYQNGADLYVIEGGEFVPEDAVPGLSSDDGATQSTSLSAKGVWNFIPVDQHLEVPEVENATRVGTYDTRLNTNGQSGSGTLMGIDRLGFTETAYFREDFAPEPLNALLNRLASNPNAVLVDRETWERFNLATGNTITLRTVINQDAFNTEFTVAGVFDLFPTWSPAEDGALFVTNLNYLFESWGSLQPYQVWLDTTPTADTATIREAINRMGVSVVVMNDARRDYKQLLGQPEHQGVSGMLSVGFIAAGGLSLIAYMVYALYSIRERFIQLGVLRAIGLTRAQMRSMLFTEQVILGLLGISTGTLAGLLTARWFIPLLPVSFGLGQQFLPRITHYAWDSIYLVYSVFGAIFFLSSVGILFYLQRLKLFRAIKMGETV
ncbi:MAG: ABC transporter permease [Anaerolineales bacterium]